MRTLGPALSPHERLARCCRGWRRCMCAWTVTWQTRLAVAQFLEEHPQVTLGQLSEPAVEQVLRPGEEIPAQRRGRAS